MTSANELRDLNNIYLTEISADTALAASKAADKKRSQLASAGDKEGAVKKMKQASRLYKASGEKRKKEPVAIADRSYPKGKGADYKEDKDWGYDKDGNSLNPVDIEKRKKKEDDLAGSPKNEEVQLEGALVKAAQGVEKVGGAVKKGVKAFNKADRAVTKATMNRVVKPAAKVVGKGVKKVAAATARGAAGAVAGAVRGAAKGIKKGLSEEQLELQNIRALVEKEVKVKDTRRVVDAIRAYDKSKDASRDADWDTEHGEKEKGDIEKKYAKKERGEIDKDDPNWKKRKYHTGIHGEEVEALKRLVESGKFSDEEIESMAWDVYEGLVEPAGTSDAAVDKATRKAATRKFGNTTPPKAKIPG